MMVKRKKTVIAAICMAVASVGFVAEVNASAPPQETQETSAPDLQNFHLAEIVVNGKRYIAGEYVRATSNIGILGEQDAMNSPISAAVDCVNIRGFSESGTGVLWSTVFPVCKP